MQTNRNNSDYLIHPALRNVNRLLVLSFKHGKDDSTRDILMSITCH